MRGKRRANLSGHLRISEILRENQCERGLHDTYVAQMGASCNHAGHLGRRQRLEFGTRHVGSHRDVVFARLAQGQPPFALAPLPPTSDDAQCRTPDRAPAIAGGPDLPRNPGADVEFFAQWIDGDHTVVEVDVGDLAADWGARSPQVEARPSDRGERLIALDLLTLHHPQVGLEFAGAELNVLGRCDRDAIGRKLLRLAQDHGPIWKEALKGPRYRRVVLPDSFEAQPTFPDQLADLDVVADLLQQAVGEFVGLGAQAHGDPHEEGPLKRPNAASHDGVAAYLLAFRYQTLPRTCQFPTLIERAGADSLRGLIKRDAIRPLTN